MFAALEVIGHYTPISDLPSQKTQRKWTRGVKTCVVNSHFGRTQTIANMAFLFATNHGVETLPCTDVLSGQLLASQVPWWRSFQHRLIGFCSVSACALQRKLEVKRFLVREMTYLAKKTPDFQIHIEVSVSQASTQRATSCMEGRP